MISPIQIGVGGIVLIAWYVSLYVDFRRLRQASLASRRLPPTEAAEGREHEEPVANRP